jgi:hypothetical protein
VNIQPKEILMLTTDDVKKFLTESVHIWLRIKDMYRPEDIAETLQQVPDLEDRVRDPKNWKRMAKYRVGGRFDQEERGSWDRFPGGTVREMALVVTDPATGERVFGDTDSQVWAVVEVDGKIVHCEFVGD